MNLSQDHSYAGVRTQISLILVPMLLISTVLFRVDGRAHLVDSL